MVADGLEHIAGAGGAEVAAGAVDGGDDALMKEDHFLGDIAEGGECFGGWSYGDFVFDIGVFAPRLMKAGDGADEDD